jgi:hypothetical protein
VLTKRPVKDKFRAVVDRRQCCATPGTRGKWPWHFLRYCDLSF